ncbi:hypothetical protein U771_22220 [Pseudomonas gorinensis]|uniref:Uncharacterized protein n=1 Tax=Pseudomonas gorinensis TaxID=3240790 RepID=A0ACA7PAC9_9PSED|nr:hypothetical protein U771_22220 [Pseudomonas sp. TKP]
MLPIAEGQPDDGVLMHRYRGMGIYTTFGMALNLWRGSLLP